jgi:UDP-N-acetylmuramyl pentapeptide synthase
MIVQKFKALVNFYLVFLCSKILQRFQKNYIKATRKKLPIILVAGTVGKSSQTLLLNQVFESLGYKVWSGTSANKNRNTLTGLILTLGQINMSLESANIWAKLIFLCKAKLIWLFKSWDFESKPNILIFEIGVDHQGEMENYLKLFKNVDWVVLSNFGPEHTAGFTDIFKEKDFFKLKLDLNNLFEIAPELDLQNKNLDKIMTAVEKNCYLEQLKLLTIAKNYILPKNYEIQKDQIIIKIENNISIISPKITRNLDYTLSFDGFVSQGDFLFPLSFVRQFIISREIASKFGLSDSSFQSILSNLILPNGRFGFFDGKYNSKIVDSSYNSDPASLNSFLDLTIEIGHNGKNYLVLGEMRELGDNSAIIHNQILKKLEDMTQNLDTEIILLGATWMHCKYNQTEFKHFLKVGEITQYFEDRPPSPNSWFWIKGSQNTIFLEVLVESLLLNQKDAQKLARRGHDWENIRAGYTNVPPQL